MVGSRTLTALIGVAVSLAVSVVLYLYTGWLLFFLFVPFVPFLFRFGGGGATPVERPPAKECPRCGFRTRTPEYEHCPRDGARLEGPRDY